MIGKKTKGITRQWFVSTRYYAIRLMKKFGLPQWR
jgi:hypothetical protein